MSMIKKISGSIFLFCIIESTLLFSCTQQNPQSLDELIIDNKNQEALFGKLLTINPNVDEFLKLNDSVSLLILPIQAACPSCRNKIIDSIIRYKEHLDKNHLIVISAKGGRKTINPFFYDRGSSMPVSKNIVIDSTNKCFELELFYDKPTMYYATRNVVYRKVSILPATIKAALAGFFSLK